MHSLKYSIFTPNIGTRHDAQASDQSCNQVTEDIAKKVGRREDIKPFWILDQLHAHIVNDLFITLNVWVFQSYFLADFEEKA